MPRYFFDMSDGEQMSRDDEGLDLPDLACAKSAAVAALPDAVRETGDPRRDDWKIHSRVRTETGRIVFEATLSFRAQDLTGDDLGERN